MLALYNFVIGCVCIVYGISSNNNILVTMGCMNVILARLDLRDVK